MVLCRVAVQKDTLTARRLMLRVYCLQAEGEEAFLAGSRILPVTVDIVLVCLV